MESRIDKRVIEDEMKESYLAYSMSVIVGRALPDIRDGLKPVHRRILYAMKDLNLLHNRAHKKSARIVGEVLGKYHPHGDTAVYDSLVRMAQDFSLRYPLIDGQGNFGNIDGDNAAAMRYTEARMKRLAEDLLEDIEKDTVDFMPNFDGSLKEPEFLPGKVPNLLINGSSGIAVGMATNIPPHNLGETCEAVTKLIDNPEVEDHELLQSMKGPDFPTGGTIIGTSGIKNAFMKGRGKVIVRSKTAIEEKQNKKAIIVTEIPYMVSKSLLLEEIANQVRDKRVEGISDLRDESDREGMRIVIELKQGANDQVVLNQLFKHTRLQDSFSMILLSVVDREPKVLGIREMLVHFLNHRKEVVKRRTSYDLRVAQEREHIVHGLIIALDHIDEVVQKIKASKTVEDAQNVLKADYSLSEKQAKAILEMRLQKLSSLEQQKLRDELEELRKTIEELQAILADEAKVLSIIKEELTQIIEKYGDERRTQIEEADEAEFEDEDLIKEQNMVVTLTHQGYVKRVPIDTYRAQGRGGKGIIATTTKEEDFVEEVFIASTHAYMLIFTNKGRVYWKKVYKIPEGSRTARGTPLVNLIEKSEEDEKVTTVIPVREFEENKFLVFATKQGTVKRTKLEYFSRPRRGGIIALTLDENDALVNVALTDGQQQMIIATKQGKAVKCKESDVSLVGRTARGVRGIRLAQNDHVIGMVFAQDDHSLLTVTHEGFGKRSPVGEYRLINRGGSGVVNIKTTEKNGEVIGVKAIQGDEDILMISKKGVAIRVNASAISVIGRNTQGVRVMRLKDDDKVVALAKCPKEDVDESAPADA